MDDPLLAAIAEEALRKLRHLMPDNLAIIAWSFAKLGVHHVPLRTAISASARPRIADFRCLNISNIVWSVAELVISDTPLMTSIASSALKSMSEFRSQDLSNTAWSFAKRVVRNAPLLAAISSASRAHQDEDNQIVSAFVWALWRGGEHSSTWHAFRSWPSLDTMAIALMLMGSGWSRNQEGDDEMWDIVGSVSIERATIEAPIVSCGQRRSQAKPGQLGV